MLYTSTLLWRKEDRALSHGLIKSTMKVVGKESSDPKSELAFPGDTTNIFARKQLLLS